MLITTRISGEREVTTAPPRWLIITRIVSLIGLLLLAPWSLRDTWVRIKPAIAATLALAALFLLEPIDKPGRRRGQQPVGWFA